MDRLNAELYKQIFDELNQLIIIFDTNQTVITANRAVLDFTGLSLDDFYGHHVSDLPLFKTSNDKLNELVFRLGHCYSMEMPQRFDAKHIDQSGDEHEIDYILKPIVQEGVVTFTIMMGYNITEMVQARKALTERDKQINAFFNNSNDGYFFFVTPEAAIIHPEMSDEEIMEVFSAQRLASINNQMYEITGIDELDENNIMNAIGIDEKEVLDIWHNLIKTGTVTVNTSIIHGTNKQKIFLSIRLIAIYDDNGDFEGNFCIVQNNTEQYLYQRELNFLANKDTLTGLNNRRNFHKLADELIESTESLDQVSIGMMDIDHFKNVNDTYGHDVGDIVISTVAEIIDHSDDDLITGRYGGEEFIVIGKADKEKMEEILESIRSTIERRVVSFGDGVLSVTISCGASSFEASDDDLQKIITQADKALYESKTSGRNRVTIYDEEILGRKAIDKLTGLLTRKSIVYKMKQVHTNFKKTGRGYSVIEINLETLIVSEFAILDQYIKQTAGILQSLMRKEDIIGRYDRTKFLVIIPSVDSQLSKKILNRVRDAMNNLSTKFDGLVTADVSMHFMSDVDDTLKDVLNHIQ